MFWNRERIHTDKILKLIKCLYLATKILKIVICKFHSSYYRNYKTLPSLIASCKYWAYETENLKKVLKISYYLQKGLLLATIRNVFPSGTKRNNSSQCGMLQKETRWEWYRVSLMTLIDSSWGPLGFIFSCFYLFCLLEGLVYIRLKVGWISHPLHDAL